MIPYHALPVIQSWDTDNPDDETCSTPVKSSPPTSVPAEVPPPCLVPSRNTICQTHPPLAPPNGSLQKSTKDIHK